MHDEIREFVKALSERPGMFFFRSENKADRLQAFMAGVDFGAQLCRSERVSWVNLLREYQRWLGKKVSGTEGAVVWFDSLRREGKSDDEILSFFSSSFDEFLSSRG